MNGVRVESGELNGVRVESGELRVEMEMVAIRGPLPPAPWALVPLPHRWRLYESPPVGARLGHGWDGAYEKAQTI